MVRQRCHGAFLACSPHLLICCDNGGDRDGGTAERARDFHFAAGKLLRSFLVAQLIDFSAGIDEDIFRSLV